MSGRTSPSLFRQLSANSAAYRDPLETLDWGSASLERWWLPPSAVSLSGVERFERLPEAARRRLSHYEFVAFIRAGLWLEGIFMERLAHALPHTAHHHEYACFLHEIREEAGHSLMFLELMERTGVRLPSFHPCRPRLLDLVARHASGSLFWLAVVIGEEVPDKLNRLVRSQPGIVDPLILSLCRLHVRDEARHIACARAAFASEFAGSGAVWRRLVGMVASRLLHQFADTFFLPSADVYELAGLTPGAWWRERARLNPRRLANVSSCVGPTLRHLAQSGLVTAGAFGPPGA